MKIMRNHSNSLISKSSRNKMNKEKENMSSSGTTSNRNDWYNESKTKMSVITSETDSLNKSSNWSLGTDVNSDPPLLEDMGLSPLIDKEKIAAKKSKRLSVKRTSKVLHPSSQENLNYAAIFQNKGTEDFFVYKRRKLESNFREDLFNRLTEEVLLEIFKYLPKFMLTRCAQVCKRFKRVAFDESLWKRLDLGGKTLDAGVVGRVLLRGAQILRLAKAEISSPIFSPQLQHLDAPYSDLTVKLQYVDLSGAAIRVEALEELLDPCINLRKMSLEHCTVSPTCLKKLSQNQNLEVLNLAMCYGLNAEGLIYVLHNCKKLQALNIAWTLLTTGDLGVICKNIPVSLQRFNISGCRNTLTDSHVRQLASCCPLLQELDVSDAALLSQETISIIYKKLKQVEYLSFARCFNITPNSYLDLRLVSSLLYLDVYGVLGDSALTMLKESLPEIKINKYLFSSVARPTVGIRRTSIWNLRVRD